MRVSYKELFNIFKPKKNLSLSLFNSESFFWLTSATAITFAAEELAKYQEKFPDIFMTEITPQKSEPFINMFKESVKSGETSNQAQKKAQEGALHNLRILANFASKNCPVFTPKAGVILGKTFAIYWLIFRLIELEWQQILNMDETTETYMLLDTVIMDHEELEQLEEYCMREEILTKDDKVYLRSHWQRVKYFWSNLYQDLELLAGGWIKFRPPYRKENYTNIKN